MRSKKSALYIILVTVVSPLLLCAIGAMLRNVGDAAILAAAYVTFGLLFVLVTGWLLSLASKNSKHPVRWLAIGYLLPILVINAAIFSLLFITS
jgi:hypothetical protein